MRESFYLTIIILFSVQFLTVAAEKSNDYTLQTDRLIKGAEKPVSRQANKNNFCYAFKDYIVKTVSREGVGEDIFVYKRTAATDPAS